MNVVVIICFLSTCFSVINSDSKNNEEKGNSDAYREISVENENINQVQLGSDFTIRCRYTGPAGVIVWFRNGSAVSSIDIDTCISSSGSNTKYIYSCDNEGQFVSLTIPAKSLTDDEHNTYWKCHDDNLRTSNVYHLFLQVPILFVDMFLRKNIDNASYLELSCITSASRPAAKIKWHQGDDTLFIVPNTAETLLEHGSRFVTMSNISFTVEDKDVVDYIFCSAHNTDTDVPVVSNKYVVQKQGAETKRLHIFKNNTLVVNEGETFTLTCDDSDSLNYTEHIGFNNAKHRFGTSTVLRQSNTLLQNALCSDSGSYDCKVTIPSNISNSAILLVKCRPDILNMSDKTITTRKGENMKLFVVFSAYPQATVNWTFKAPDHEKEINLEQSIEFTIFRESDQFTDLSIIEKSNITDEDIGEYKVKLENSLGIVMQSFQVTDEDETNGYSVGDGTSGHGITFLPRPVVLAMIISASTISSLALSIILCFFNHRRRQRYKMQNIEIENDGMEYDSNTDAYGSSSSEADLELGELYVEYVPDYENDCIAKELETDSYYDDLEPENPIQTAMEWPYEEVEQTDDYTTENISLTYENTKTRDPRSDATEDRDYNNIFMSINYENCNENDLLPPSETSSTTTDFDVASTSSYEK